MNVSTFLFSGLDISIMDELEAQFKKLNFKITNGNTASFQLPNDEKIKAFLIQWAFFQFTHQLTVVVKRVWSDAFTNGDLEVGSFAPEGSTSFAYVNSDMVHTLCVKGKNHAPDGYRITLECRDINQSSGWCTIS
jgi:hypothetical protein